MNINKKYKNCFKEGDLVTPNGVINLGKDYLIYLNQVGMIYKIFHDPLNNGNYFLGVFWFNLSQRHYCEAPHPDGIYIHHWTQIRNCE